MYHTLKSVVFLCILFTVSTFASADTFKSQRSTFLFLKEIYSSMDLDDIINTHMMPNSIHHDKYRNYVQAILLNDETLNAISQIVFENKSLLIENPSLAGSLGSSWAMSTAMKGLTRLSDEDQRFLLELTLLQIKALDTNSCALMLASEISDEELAPMGFQALESLPSNLVSAYLTTLQQALFAEIRDNPMQRVLSTSEQEIANAAFEKAYIDALIDHIDTDNLITAATTPKLSSAPYICENGKVLFESILNIPGFTGSLAVRNLISQMY